MEKLTQQHTNLVASAMLAKSLSKSRTFINKDTGVFFSYSQAVTLVSFNLAEYEEDIHTKARMIYKALKEINPIKGIEKEIMENIIPSFGFFADQFKDFYSEKVEVNELFLAYSAKFGACSRKKFYTELAKWCVELSLPRSIKGKGNDKKVVVIRE